MADILAGFMALPMADIHALLRGRRALVLAPHADDESLGCGGFIAAACAAGLSPHVVILTDGAASHPGSVAFPPARLRAVREAEALQAANMLGLPAANLNFLRYPDSQLPASGPGSQDITVSLLKIARAGHCTLLIAPWAGDPHGDHVAAAAIAEAVARRADFQLLSYPLWGWLRNNNDLLDEPRAGGWRLDITAHLSMKTRVIAAHRSQTGDLIADCPNGFILPVDLLAICARPFEVFIA